jgi:hypothetical protein
MRKNTDAILRDGTTLSSDEGTVMGPERRGCAVALIVMVNW